MAPVLKLPKTVWGRAALVLHITSKSRRQGPLSLSPLPQTQLDSFMVSPLQRTQIRLLPYGSLCHKEKHFHCLLPPQLHRTLGSTLGLHYCRSPRSLCAGQVDVTHPGYHSQQKPVLKKPSVQSLSLASQLILESSMPQPPQMGHSHIITRVRL